jgi:hypothetical protein
MIRSLKMRSKVSTETRVTSVEALFDLKNKKGREGRLFSGVLRWNKAVDRW